MGHPIVQYDLHSPVCRWITEALKRGRKRREREKEDERDAFAWKWMQVDVISEPVPTPEKIYLEKGLFSGINQEEEII